MVELPHSIHGSALGQGTRDGTKHGGPPQHCAPPSAAVIPPPSMARVQYSVPDGDGRLCGPGVDLWRPMAIRCVPTWPAPPK